MTEKLEGGKKGKQNLTMIPAAHNMINTYTFSISNTV